MTSALLHNPYAIFAGWSLIVVLWGTTGIAMLFGAWRLLSRRTRPDAEYRAALVALFTAAAFAAALPVALALWGGNRTPSAALVESRISTSVRTTLMPLAPGIANGLEGLRRDNAISAPIDAIAGAAAFAWAAVALVLAIRFAGGWMLTRRLAARADPVRDADLARLAADAAVRAGVRQPFDLRESVDVEAPVVLRWRRPLLLVPRLALPKLGADQLSALLVHELAHVRRRDYAVNLLQSIVELPLFFSPAILWLSHRVREAREFCCDEAAVAQCGDRARYVEALTTLAALGTVNGGRIVLGISGPRLITRVRRLLKEDPMPRFTFMRTSILAVALGALVVTGIQLSAASATRAPRRAASQAQSRLPYGYAPDQEGSGVRMTPAVAEDGSSQGATITNVSTERVNGVRLLAIIERLSAGNRMPVTFFVTEELPVLIGPGQAVDVKADVLTAAQIEEAARHAPGARLQAFYALQSVRFANGHIWEITPNRDATSGSDAIGTPRPILPRSFIERDAAKPPVPGAACRDDRDRTYSLGAVVPILNEPGRFVRCVDGRWDRR